MSQRIQSPYAVELGMTYGNPSIARHCQTQGTGLRPYTAVSVVSAIRRQQQRAPLVPYGGFAAYPQHAGHPHHQALPRPSGLHRGFGSERSRTLGGHGEAGQADHELSRRAALYAGQGRSVFCECHKTARLLAEALKLDTTQYTVCFQSRFGKAEWVQPYFATTLAEFGKQKMKRVDVICPGFSSDCLETLEEIALEGKHIFQQNGGGEYHYIPALNEREAWIHAMTDIALENLQGWISTEWDAEAAAKLDQAAQARAQALGAKS